MYASNEIFSSPLSYLMVGVDNAPLFIGSLRQINKLTPTLSVWASSPQGHVGRYSEDGLALPVSY